jgi:hypothetical protein
VDYLARNGDIQRRCVLLRVYRGDVEKRHCIP